MHRLDFVCPCNLCPVVAWFISTGNCTVFRAVAENYTTFLPYVESVLRLRGAAFQGNLPSLAAFSPDSTSISSLSPLFYLSTHPSSRPAASSRTPPSASDNKAHFLLFSIPSDRHPSIGLISYAGLSIDSTAAHSQRKSQRRQQRRQQQ